MNSVTTRIVGTAAFVGAWALAASPTAALASSVQHHEKDKSHLITTRK